MVASLTFHREDLSQLPRIKIRRSILGQPIVQVSFPQEKQIDIGPWVPNGWSEMRDMNLNDMREVHAVCKVIETANSKSIDDRKN